MILQLVTSTHNSSITSLLTVFSMLSHFSTFPPGNTYFCHFLWNQIKYFQSLLITVHTTFTDPSFNQTSPAKPHNAPPNSSSKFNFSVFNVNFKSEQLIISLIFVNQFSLYVGVFQISHTICFLILTSSIYSYNLCRLACPYFVKRICT